VHHLISKGAEVHALTSTVSSVYPVRLLGLREHISLHGGSLTDPGAMAVVGQRVRPRFVLHLGAYTHVGKSWDRVDECVQTNVQGTVNLLQALASTGYERFVYVSTSEVYGDIDVPFSETSTVNPLSPYSVSKYAGERFCRMFHQGRGWPIVVVRPFNAFGPAQSPDRIVPEIIVKALRQERLAMTEGYQTREFNYVEDLAEGFIRAATVPALEGQVVNLGGGEEISMRDLAKTILDIMGSNLMPEFGALPERPTEIARMYSDTTRTRSVLGYRPRHSLEEGLERTIAWYRAELDKSCSAFAL
jgi:nucleoside-diphosphate-sugar epimerase